MWPALPGFALAHALMGSFICAVVALLLVAHATSTRRRGYVSVAGTFWYMAVVLLFFPAFFPEAVVNRGQLWGGQQSAPDLYFSWHIVFPIGIAVSALIIYSDQVKHRRPDLTTTGLWAWMGAATAAAMATVLVVGLAWRWLPPVITGTQKSAYGEVLDWVVLGLCVLCFVISVYCARTGALIGWWLAAVSLLLLGEAIVNQNATARYAVGWYTGRLLWLATSSSLLVALIWNLSRVDRANALLAEFDATTGCRSRVSLLNALQLEMARAGKDSEKGERVALYWVDIDNFKGVNDQLGHRQGDDVLRQVVERISEQVRPQDYVGRLGGDEFGVIVCDGVDRQSAVAVARRVLAAVREPIRTGENTIRLTVSVGGALGPDDAQTPEELLMCADLAMYASKSKAGDRFEWYDPVIGAQAVEQARLRHALNTAIAEREFCLHYQPIFENDGRTMAGAEALVRWQRDGQVLSAGQFIPSAEQSGQVVAIGRQVIELLAEDLPRWLQITDEGFFLAVNLSVKELADNELIDAVIGIREDVAECLVVELTESLELEDNKDAQVNLYRLRAAGIRLAIDDFGTGFSNFTRLERLQPSILKVDRSLVRKAAAEPMADDTFLTAATSVASSLHCAVVAEGIDDEAAIRAVQKPGITYVQGFSYGKPAPLGAYLLQAANRTA